VSLSIPIISEFDGKGVKQAIKQFKQLEGVGAKAQFAIKKAAIPAAAAIGGLAFALGDATKAAMEDAAAQTQLALALENSAGASAAQVKQTEDFIGAMSRATGVADDNLRPAMAALVRGTKDVQAAQNLMSLTLDISTGLQMDQTTVAEALAKAQQGNFKALRSLTPEMAALIKEGADLNTVMDVLGGTFGGAASEAAETAAGKMKILSNSVAETKESIGAALLPVVEAALPILQKFADWAQKNPNAFLAIAAAIGGVAIAITAVNFAMALNPFTAIAAGIALLVVGVIYAYKQFETFRNGVNAIINTLLDVFENLANTWLRVVNTIISAYNKIPLLPDIPSLPAKINLPTIAQPTPTARNTPGGIRMMADGGIVTSPTIAMIGEAGPEAVIPLDRMKNSGGITVNVTGGLATSAEIGQAVVNAIRAYNRSAGPANIQVA
jgi:ElaB/YqjD/DUF883 family membrane-anchored ribosome-binding protein